MLISAAELAANLDHPDWVVFDCRHDLGNPDYGPEAYAQQHIKGAYFADIEEDLSGRKTGSNGRHPLPAPEDFASFLGRCGVTDQSRIIAYDDAHGQYAARLWMMTRWLGLPPATVLQGGWQAWLAEGHPTDAIVPPVGNGQVEYSVDSDLLVSVEEVEASLADRSRLIVDARAPGRFTGEVVLMDGVAGHIPGAVNRFYEDNLNEARELKDADSLRAGFRQLLGDTDPSRVVHQCGSGITGCVNMMAMEKAGLEGSRIFIGSWSEWSSDASRPVATGDQ